MVYVSAFSWTRAHNAQKGAPALQSGVRWVWVGGLWQWGRGVTVRWGKSSTFF